MKMHPLFAVLSLTVASLATAAPEAAATGDEVIQVGSRGIKVPVPAGYVRCDGIYDDWDKLTQSMLPQTNRMLATYGTPADHELLQSKHSPSYDTNYNLQILREFENQELGERTFADLRGQFKGELQKVQADTERQIQQAIAKGNRAIKEHYGVDDMLKISNTVVLGFFEESDTALGFTMAMNINVKQASGETATSRSVVAAIMAPVNGRLLFLYATRPFKGAEDQSLAEHSVATWRDIVLAANPRVQGPSARWFDWSKVSRATLIGVLTGAAIGAIIGLLAFLKRKRG